MPSSTGDALIAEHDQADGGQLADDPPVHYLAQHACVERLRRVLDRANLA